MSSSPLLPIPGYEGYAADANGGIWSVASNWRGYGPRQLTTNPDDDGYLRVRIYRGGRRISKVVHVLVCLAFHGEKPTGMQVRHLDDDKRNNLPSNLKWGTHRENEDDAIRNKKKAVGSKHGMSKLTETDVFQIRDSLAKGILPRVIAPQFGVCTEMIRLIKQGRNWSHVN